MDWIVEHWSHISLAIAVIFIAAIFLIRKFGGRKGNAIADELEKWMSLANDRDAVLKQTFENVEALKKEWRGDKHIGQIFKKLNEDVDMEKLTRENYIRLLGDKVDLKPEAEEDIKTG